MVDITPEFQSNIDLLKTVPGVTEVVVEETSDHIERQLGGVDCYSVVLRKDNGKSISMIVPKQLCHADDFELNDGLMAHFKVYLEEYVPVEIRNEQLSFFVDPVTQKLIQLDGRKIIMRMTEEQQTFVDYLKENVEGCLDVMLSTVVDPVLMEQTVSDDDVFMHYRVAGFIHPFGMLLHESSYKNVDNRHNIAETMRQDIFKAASEKL